MLFIIILTIIVSVLTILNYFYHFNHRLPPGPWGIPIVGVLPFINLDDPINSATKLKLKYGPLVSARLGAKLVLFLLDFDVVKEALEEQGNIFADRPYFRPTNTGTRDLGHFQNGPNCKKIRKFTQTTLQAFVRSQTMETKMQDEIDQFLVEIDERQGNPFDATFSRLMVNVIANLIFGHTFEDKNTVLEELTKICSEVFVSHPCLTLSLYGSIFTYLPGYKSEDDEDTAMVCRMVGCVQKLVDENQNNESGNPESILDLLITRTSVNKEDSKLFLEQSHPENIAPNSLVTVLMDLFGAGTDPTASTLEWAFGLLITQPDVQRNIQNEIDDVIGKQQKVSYEDRSRLPHCLSFCMEVQRFGNIAPFSPPRVTNMDTTLRNYFIPKGTIVMPALGLLHIDPKYYDSPNIFKPFRFIGSDGKVNERPPSFMPIGTGKRICPGFTLANRMIFLTVVTLLQKYTFVEPSGQPNPTLNPQYGYVTITKPTPFKMVAVKRI